MADQDLINRTVMALLRCSTLGQKKDSIPQQASWLRDFADENQMIYVGEIQESLGVSQTQNRPDIDYLMQRKRQFNDFDTILVQDLSRLTRGGLEHGLKLYFEFQVVGLQILSIVDGLIDGEEKLKEAIRRFESDRATVKTNALLTVRGRIRSRKEGRTLYSFRVPLGLDRLFSFADGVPLHILRNLPDGTQQQLDPTGTDVLRKFDSNVNGERRHYVKQAGEYVTLVSGHPERVEAVRQIYRWYFVDGIGITGIAVRLNNAEILSATGREWSCRQVKLVLRNAIYIGRGIANRMTAAIFYKAGANTPQPVSDDGKGKSKASTKPSKKHALLKYRPKEEWFEQIFPDLQNFLGLDEKVRERIWSYQKEHHERLAAQLPRKPGGDRYPESEYILKGVLRSKQGDHRMTGCKSKNRHGTVFSYYRVVRGRTHPKSDSVFNRMVPSGLLEDAAMQVLRQAISSYDDIRPTIVSVLQQDQQSLASDRDDLPKLRRERQAVEDSIDFYVKDMAVLGVDAVRRKADPLRHKLIDFGHRIEAAERALLKEKPNVSAVADSVERRCGELASSLAGMSRLQVRTLLQSLVPKMVVDLETRETEMEVAMPSWVIDNDVTLGICADGGLSRQTSNCANQNWAIPLGTFRCQQQHVNRKQCMVCSRSDRTNTSDNISEAA
jgi:hypothetical protein